MHRALPEMLQSLNLPQNMSVLLRQQEEIIQQQEQQQLLSFINGNDQQMSMFPQFQGQMNIDQGLGELLSPAMKQEPVAETVWNGFGGNCVGYTNYAIPRTISCPPDVAAAMVEAAVAAGKAEETTTTPAKMSSAVGREDFKKRKVDKNQTQKVTKEEEAKEKKMKGCATQGDSKIAEQHSNSSNAETSGDASKENSKFSEVKRPDYIHVRARRGQATDSHSLAERVRREKISERMKFLQDLVPGCNKIVGKAGMLDEIINYVQSLQRQVEFLSMKLAAVNPTIDFNIDSFFPKEMFSAGLPSEMANPANLQFNPLQQVMSCSGIETSVSNDMALRRTISAPVSSVPEALLDQSCFNQTQNSSSWDANLQNYHAMEIEQGKSDSIFSQPFAGYIELGHVKLEI